MNNDDDDRKGRREDEEEQAVRQELRNLGASIGRLTQRLDTVLNSGSVVDGLTEWLLYGTSAHNGLLVPTLGLCTTEGKGEDQLAQGGWGWLAKTHAMRTP